MRDKTLPRRQRVKIRRRQEMLDAAGDLFCEKGYHNVTMQEVAGRAEFAIGTLYKFFENKEDLYSSLILQQCDRFEEAMLRTIEGPDDEVEKLSNYARVRGDRCRENLSLIRMFLAESHGASASLKAGLCEDVRKRRRAFLGKLARIFESGMQKGRFRKVADPFHLAVALDSILDAFLLLWVEAPDRHPYPKNVERILDVFFSGLVDSRSQGFETETINDGTLEVFDATE